METAKVSEMFISYQGEGPFAGSRQLFVRFYGCNRACIYCDTLPESYETFTKDGLMRKVLGFKDAYNELVVTGGEPLLFADFLRQFLACFKSFSEKAVYLETNGTLPGELSKVIDHVDIVAMDFKFPSSSGDTDDIWDAHEKFAETAAQKELIAKAVITDRTTMDDVKHMARIIRGIKKDLNVVLQPVTPMNAMIREPDGETLSGFAEYLKNTTEKDIMILGQLHRCLGIR
ncbi:MAG: 7-carboxy-7-deazaguanine synthase QueE [Candidatus Omnitrophica bacterium]|nr:7-carboxy-7-deazaguanine synthase QueE [Candidatus Omnitrophota bacterium]